MKCDRTGKTTTFTFFWSAAHSVCSEESTVCSILHAWAHRRLRMASVTVSNRREKVCHLSQPGSTILLSLLSHRQNLNSWFLVDTAPHSRPLLFTFNIPVSTLVTKHAGRWIVCTKFPQNMNVWIRVHRVPFKVFSRPCIQCSQYMCDHN